jgi:hypothetical protein
MKKFFIFCFLCYLSLLVNAQVFVGAQLNVHVPHQSAITLDAGIGGNLSIGYSVTNNLDLSVYLDYNRFSAIVAKYSIKSFGINGNYYFLNGGLRPFIGIGAGLFQERYSRPLDFPDYYQNAFGLQPSIGLLFNNDNLNGLKVKTNLSYNYIFTSNPLSTFSFSIGIVNYF